VAESYSQARQKLSLMIHSDDDPVQVYEGESPKGYFMPRAAETRIENFLATGDEESALAELGAVVDENRKRSSGEADMRLLHLLSYNIARRVLEGVGGSAADVCPGCDRLSEDISNEAPLFEVHEKLELFYREVCRYVAGHRARGDVREITQYIQDNYAENIYLEAIADHFGLSYKYLSHKIKDYLGIPFQQYLTNLRISKAKELLLSTDRPISDVAAEVGYESTSTFYRVFKKNEGITAGEYRRARTRDDASV
jgi:AraC-like DNA-binding protein